MINTEIIWVYVMDYMDISVMRIVICSRWLLLKMLSRLAR